MKKLSIALIALILSLSLFAQETEVTTVVAVGEAERQVEKFHVNRPQIESELKGDESQRINEFFELLRNDFSFYKHRYEVPNDLQPAAISPAYSKWKEAGVSYVTQSRVYQKEQQLYLELKTYSTVQERAVFEFNDKFLLNQGRKFGHEIADKIYQALNQKPSIFTKQIVFVSDRTSQGSNTRKELYVMDFDGKGIKRLTYNNSMVIAPSISPDNNKILFTMIEDKWQPSSQGKPIKVKNLNLYMYNLSTGKTELISDQNGLNNGAIFNHDGSKIYLTLSHQTNADIYEMDLATRKVNRKITSHYGEDVDPSINADGSLMTWLSNRPGKAMIYTCNPNGTEQNVKRISFVGKFNAAPKFSPDGKEIVFSSWVDERFDIYKLGSDGSNLVRLTKNFGSNEEASFSPDGEFIIFTSQRVISRSKAEQHIYIMNKDGEIVRQLTENYGKAFTPRWTN